MTGAEGLRERKKQATRERIVHVGMELFAERGFDGTTVADIAAAADISPRTFFAYFPSKESLVFCDADEKLEIVRGWLRDRPAGANVIDAIRDGAMAMLSGMDEAEHAAERERKNLVAATPSLQAHADHVRSGFAAVIAEGVADQFGESPDDVRPRLVGATTLTAISLVDDAFHAGLDSDDPAAEATELITTALDFLRGGLEALEAADSSARR
ncbi:TetR family transcriptional regulator [Thermoleophilia bacterium SCSIO 60948]|nr:TetR family transcriptional regulator [Thermoleophilia bacterium SCSIO 60948]